MPTKAVHTWIATPQAAARDDPYALTAAQVHTLAKALRCSVDNDKYDFYLESEADWIKVAEMRDAITGT